MPNAGAEPTGVEKPGTVIIGAERLFGYASTTSTAESKGADPVVTSTVSRSTFGLLVTNATSALTVPRIAFDINAAYGITLGGALGYASSSGEVEDDIAGRKFSSDAPKATAVVVAPRLGWLTMSGITGFWARAGFTYFSQSEKSSSTSGTTTTSTEISSTGLSAQVEPSLLIAPFDHVMFSLGAHLNLPLSGSAEIVQSGTTTTTTDFTTKLSSYGVSAGVHAWF